MKTSPSVSRRVALAGAALLSVAVLTSCASDGTVAVGSASDTTTAVSDTNAPATDVPETTTPSTDTTTPSGETTTPGSTPDTAAQGEGIDFSNGANDVVVKIDNGVGGFRTFQSTFAAIPALLVTGDGRVFTEGPTTMEFPGAFLPNLQVATINEAAVRMLLDDAKTAGLLSAIPDYTVGQPNVTDVGSTILTLTANGQTYVHEAFALGMEQTDAPARKALMEFIESTKATLSSLPSQKFVPETYLLATQPADISPDTTVDPASGDPEVRLQGWPAEIGIDLKDLTCAPVASSKVQDLFEKADQLTFFFQDSGIYSLAVRPVFPGQPGCESVK